MRMEQIASAINRLAMHPDIEIAVAMHYNPAVRTALSSSLSTDCAIYTFEPLPYPDFIGLLESSDVVLTDSGGLQEEAATLGKQVLILNETTERPEATATGVSQVVGTNADQVYRATMHSIATISERQTSAAQQIFGDGYAAKRILEVLSSRLMQ